MLRFDGGVRKDFSTPHMQSRLSSLEWVECTKRNPAISVVRLTFECTRQPHTQPDRTPMSMLCQARHRTHDSGASQVQFKQLNGCGKQPPLTHNLTCLSSWTDTFCQQCTAKERNVEHGTIWLIVHLVLVGDTDFRASTPPWTCIHSTVGLAVFLDPILKDKK